MAQERQFPTTPPRTKGITTTPPSTPEKKNFWTQAADKVVARLTPSKATKPLVQLPAIGAHNAEVEELFNKIKEKCDLLQLDADVTSLRKALLVKWLSVVTIYYQNDANPSKKFFQDFLSSLEGYAEKGLDGLVNINTIIVSDVDHSDDAAKKLVAISKTLGKFLTQPNFANEAAIEEFLEKEFRDRGLDEEADRLAKERADRLAKEEAEAKRKAKIEEFAQNFISKANAEAIKEAAEAKKAKILADKESAKIANDQLEDFSSLFKSPLQKLKDELELLIAEEKAAQEELEAKLKDVETANEELMKVRKEVSIASLELKKLKLKDTRGEKLTNREAETYKQKDYSILDKDISEKEKELKSKIEKAEKKAQEAAEANKHFGEALGAFNQKSEEAKEQAERIEGYEARFSESIGSLKKAFSNYVKEMIEAQGVYDTKILAAKNSILAELVKLMKSKFTSDLKEGVEKILAIQGANEGVVVQVSLPVNGRLLNLNTSISDLLSKTVEFIDSTMYEHNKSLAQPKKSQNKDVMKKAFEALKGALAEDLELQGYKAALKAAKYSDEKIGKLEAKLQEVWTDFTKFARGKEKAIEDLFSGFGGSEADEYKAFAKEATEKLESAIAHHNIIAEFMGENCFHLGGMINGAEHIALEVGLSREGMVEGAIAHKECLGDLASLF